MDGVTVNKNITCRVCGENNFTVREGFYFCLECGTKHDQIRAIEVDEEDGIKDTSNYKKIKLQQVKAETVELTSWECYNYLLRGFVEELLAMGANENIKLVALQVWAAYLRTNEVAFFSIQRAELPKLGVRYLERDARTIYNHQRSRRLKRKRNANEIISIASDSSKRKLTKAKRQLDEAEYALMSSTEASQTASSSSAATARAIQLNYSSRARKYLKKIVPVKHLKKHEMDVTGEMKCHRLKPTKKELNRMEYALTTLNLKQIYTVLAIALNLTGDDIQLSDLVRFIHEDHIGLKNALQYFPENVRKEGKKMMREVRLTTSWDKYTDKCLRDHVGNFAKFIHIRQFHRPNMLKLISRYVMELNLPKDLYTFLQRLINFLPPEMKTRAPHQYPQYEARAMAYIVFALKLLFGLDGHKERELDRSTKKVNQKIEEFSKLAPGTQHPLLFEWTAWTKFIEMRKVIISQYNSSFARRFNEPQSISQRLEHLRLVQRDQEEQDALLDPAPSSSQRVTTMREIFEKFVNKCNEASGDEVVVEIIKFEPSLTPGASYLKRIKAQHQNTSKKHIVDIPAFMNVDHSEHTLVPYVRAKKLRSFFASHQWRLNVERVDCTEDREFVGVFHTSKEERSAKSDAIVKADFNISEKAWLNSLKSNITLEELNFNTTYTQYGKHYMKKLSEREAKRQEHERKVKEIAEEMDSQSQDKESKGQGHERAVGEMAEELDSQGQEAPAVSGKANLQNGTSSFPESGNLQAPRRQLDTVNIFDDLSEDEDDNKPSISVETAHKRLSNDTDGQQEVLLLTSSMDCWLIAGIMYGMTDTQKKSLAAKFPGSFYWLLEICAQTIGVEWTVLYEQLLAIEVMFAFGIEDLHGMKDCIKFNYLIPVKEINQLVNSFRAIW